MPGSSQNTIRFAVQFINVGLIPAGRKIINDQHGVLYSERQSFQRIGGG